MIVYRVENEAGLGPYQDSADLLPRMMDAHDGNLRKNHPLPEEDIRLKSLVTRLEDWTATHVCGFSSMKQVEAWFTEQDLTAMAKHGQVLKTFKVPKSAVIVGTTQALIEKESLSKLRGF